MLLAINNSPINKFPKDCYSQIKTTANPHLESVPMSLARSSIEQTDPPRSPKETLPTMYDLPSENPEEPGLPDEYHYLQPQILSATFRLSNYTPEQVFTTGDMNLYYDSRYPLWYKRPDWFAVLGVPRLYEQRDLRLSYVIWQEGVCPSIVVELLSPGTGDEDLGKTQRASDDEPPTKWEVYEQILRVPYYVVFNRYTDQLRAFTLVAGQYQELELSAKRVWMPTLNIGLGLWQGEYGNITRQWLRWYDARGSWISTEAEQERQRTERERQRAEQERQRAERERQRAEQAELQLQQVARNLLQTGMVIEQVASLTGLSESQVQQLAFKVNTQIE